jgi:hypothetical protein
MAASRRAAQPAVDNATQRPCIGIRIQAFGAWSASLDGAYAHVPIPRIGTKVDAAIRMRQQSRYWREKTPVSPRRYVFE